MRRQFLFDCRKVLTERNVAMKFTKMHGIGNDYVYVNGFEEKLQNPAEIARKVSDRHFGVGSDGLVLILPSEKADFKMRMFNADGSEAEMCGNGIRCLAKYVYENGMTSANVITVETLAGVKTLKLLIQEAEVQKVRVNMGQPQLERSQIPMKGPDGMAVAEPIEVNGDTFLITCVSMGNPHTVVYVEDLERFPVTRLGPIIETLALFPNRTNVEFVEAPSPGEVRIRTWERGTGETLACGSGACAVCVAGVLNKKTERKITAHLRGGDLELEWRKSDGCVYMTGPAVTVFTGHWEQH